VSGERKGKRRREYPQRQPQKSLLQSSSLRESDCQRRQWWLRAERSGLRKRLLHEGLSSRLEGGEKGKGSDKGGGREREGGEGKGKLHSDPVTLPNDQIWSSCLIRPLLLTPSTLPFPFFAHMMTPAQSANLISSLFNRPSLCCRFDECLHEVGTRDDPLGFALSISVLPRATGRSSRPDAVRCFRDSAYLLSDPMPVSIERIK
jgi:hypothetical protein